MLEVMAAMPMHTALMAALEELEAAYASAKADPAFQSELARLLKPYAGRPTPLYHAANLSRQLGGAQFFPIERRVLVEVREKDLQLFLLDLLEAAPGAGFQRLAPQLPVARPVRVEAPLGDHIQPALPEISHSPPLSPPW